MSKPSFLPPGTIIEWHSARAIVINDRQDGFIEVNFIKNGPNEVWSWELDGDECKIISLPGDAKKNKDKADFETWWNKNKISYLPAPILEQAFKELAHNVWMAARENNS